MLHSDHLGLLQIAGVSIKGVSYIATVMSIGLLVDFLIHVLIRYYESTETIRIEKVRDTLKTVGVSVLIGNMSTFLGVIPLVFSASDVFFTIYVSFMGLIVVGAAHGLILLPVLLSIMGPNSTITFESDGDEETNTGSSV